MAVVSGPLVPERDRISLVIAGFRAPQLPPISRRAFRYHIAFTLLYAVFEGITANAPLMAVNAMHATDVQLQLPLAMGSGGLFTSVLLGATMAKHNKKPFVLVPGFIGALAAFLMAWIPDAGWFLFMAGVISICDFAMRPGVPSIMRIVYPHHCRSRVSGTMRQYGSISFLCATVGSAALLSASTNVFSTIRFEIILAGLASAAAFFCFRQLPDRGDGNSREADVQTNAEVEGRWPTLAPLRDKTFLPYLGAFFVFGFGNLFHQGVIPSFFSRDLGLGYVQATLLIHVIPSITAFLAGGHLTSWFERTSVWRSYSVVALLWGLDPLILSTAPSVWPALVLARSLRGPATLGSMVIAFFTGVHSFARPGRDTSRYMAAQFLINGLARLLAPVTAAIAAGYLSRRSMIFLGSVVIIAGSAMFWWGGTKDTADRTES